MLERSGLDLGVYLIPEQPGRGLGYDRRPGTALAMCMTEFSLSDCVSMKRSLFTPSTDPTPTPPTALLLFIQRAQLALVYQEPVETEVAKDPAAPKHAA